MQEQLLTHAVMMLAGVLAAPSAPSSACDLIRPSEIAAITGRAERIDRVRSKITDPGKGLCIYRDEEGGLTLTLIRTHSVPAARRKFAAELAAAAGSDARTELLRGLATEARYVARRDSTGGTIIVRYQAIVFAWTGRADQKVLTALARAVIARLAAATPPSASWQRDPNATAETAFDAACTQISA